jgi:SAM-dependent methyltransferase
MAPLDEAVAVFSRSGQLRLLVLPNAKLGRPPRWRLARRKSEFLEKWTDYNLGYRDAFHDESFLAWRQAGARQKAANIASICRKIEVSSAIEIGCGTGAVLRELAAKSFAKRYVGTDISAAAIEFAKESCRPFLDGVHVGAADFLPFPAKSFSVAILSHVVEHLRNPVSAVRSAARVADYLVIEVPIEKVLSNTIRRRILGKPFLSAAGAGHLQFWSTRSIAKFLEQDCQQEILSRKLDFFDCEDEFHGRTGLRMVKPLIKQALKAVTPGWVYARLLTTHATFLCRERAVEEKKGNHATDSAEKDAL